MSKLSVHISSGNRSGFTDWLDKCAAGGNPIGIVYSVDENISGDLAQHSPSTKWVYRYQTDEFNRLPHGFFETEPVQNCTTWMTKTKDSHKRTLIQNWALNKADWFDPLNEPVPDIPAKAQWINTWLLTALEIANQNGFKLALLSLPSGNPPLDMWQYMLPALKRGRELGAILSLHAYWSTEHPESDPDNALRYRDVYQQLPKDARLPIVLSEASPGNGYDPSDHVTGSDWVNNMARYDVEIMKDPYVLGACGFQLGGQESNLRSILPQYGDYIAKTPTPVVIETDDSVTDSDTISPSDPNDQMQPPVDELPTTTDTPSTPDTSSTTTDTTTTPPIVSSGPLSFDVHVVNCRRNPEQSNGIIVTFQFEVTGGSAPYTYIHEDQILAGPAFDRLATRSGPIIDSFAVTSADGQTQQKKLFFSPKDMNCT